ncbi:MAG: PEGA domain-containing protein [Planctomycetes bacterium]|nr:PEGA domain-containing protein [Planctomycetota bacterium]
MRPSLLVPAQLVALLLALAGAAGCVSIAPPGTFLASEPPGASVLVDGRDSGWVTPCTIALDEDEIHVVRVALEGYAPREVVLNPDRRLLIASWDQAVSGVKSTLRFPTRMPAGQFLFPFREFQTLAPGRVFVRLRPEPAP